MSISCIYTLFLIVFLPLCISILYPRLEFLRWLDFFSTLNSVAMAWPPWANPWFLHKIWNPTWPFPPLGMGHWFSQELETGLCLQEKESNSPCSRKRLVALMLKNLPVVRETRVQNLALEDALEKGVATHSSILAWRISWTEEPGGLHSLGSQRVEHSWATNTLTFSLRDQSGNYCCCSVA